MTLKDAEAMRQLRAQIETLTNRVADLERRADDSGKAQRALVDEVSALKPKRTAA